jgi:hypothetical protein
MFKWGFVQVGLAQQEAVSRANRVTAGAAIRARSDNEATERKLMNQQLVGNCISFLQIEVFLENPAASPNRPHA